MLTYFICSSVPMLTLNFLILSLSPKAECSIQGQVSERDQIGRNSEQELKKMKQEQINHIFVAWQVHF